MNFLPFKVRQALYYRFFNSWDCHQKHKTKFEKARLKFAGDPSFEMFELVVGDVISGNIAFNGFYELKLSHYLSKIAKNGGLLVDVGANMGYFSLLWLSHNPNNRTIAIEASPHVAKKLKNNVIKNKLGTRAKVFEIAAGKENGTVSFDVASEEQTGWGGIAKVASSATIDVPMKKIDSFVDEQIDFLKIDIEGADTWAIQGCENLLKNKKIKIICFEENRPRMRELGISEGEGVEYIKQFGYRVEPFVTDNGKPVEWIAYLS